MKAQRTMRYHISNQDKESIYFNEIYKLIKLFLIWSALNEKKTEIKECSRRMKVDHRNANEQSNCVLSFWHAFGYQSKKKREMKKFEKCIY